MSGDGLRRALIARRAILPLEARPTLRIDDAGRAEAARHIAEYARDPSMAFRHFVPEDLPWR